jgi:ABC-type dipeptide/oligopeptide/nickel transport system permease component
VFRFLLSRSAQALATLLVLITITFFLVHAAPAGP